MPPAARRGRPPDPELAEERRAALIAAAAEVFAERGYVAAGIADIDARLEVGRGTFYRHFESKRELLDHVVDDAIARLVAAVMPDSPLRADTAEEFLDKLDELVGRVFTVVRAEPGIVRLLLMETTSIDEEMTLRLLGSVDAVTAVVASVIDEGVRAGYLRADLDSGVVAGKILYLLVPGLLRVQRGFMDDEDVDRYRRGVVDLVAHGIAPTA